MAFFSRKQKQIALKTNSKTIKEQYQQTELYLKQCAVKGNEKELKKAIIEVLKKYESYNCKDFFIRR